jgi:hypothetical protein
MIDERQLILFNALGFLISSINNTFLNVPDEEQKSKIPFSQIFKSYFEVWKQIGEIRIILLTICLVNFFSGGLSVLLPFLGKVVNADHYSRLLFAQALGAALGGLIMTKFSYNLRWKDGQLLLLGCGLLALGLHKDITPYVHFIFIFLYGLFLSIFNINFFTVVQEVTPSNIIGRTFGLIFTVGAGLVPLGNFLFSKIGTWVPNLSIQIVGAGLVLTILFLFPLGKIIENRMK